MLGVAAVDVWNDRDYYTNTLAACHGVYYRVRRRGMCPAPADVALRLFELGLPVCSDDRPLPFIWRCDGDE